MKPQEELIKRIDEVRSKTEDMKVDYLTAEANVAWNDAFDKAISTIKSFLKGYEIVKKGQLEKLSEKLDLLKKGLEDYRDLRALLGKTHVMVKKGTCLTKDEVQHIRNMKDRDGIYSECLMCQSILNKLKALGRR